MGMGIITITIMDTTTVIIRGITGSTGTITVCTINITSIIISNTTIIGLEAVWILQAEAVTRMVEGEWMAEEELKERAG